MEKGILMILNKLSGIEVRLGIVEKLLGNHLIHSTRLIFILVGIIASVVTTFIIKLIL